ncbi:hypothetical protein GCM10010385_68790 [Streptomyces geysiriensis]|nr:hypothetical protein GCM10010385_68790 [Streptomyces geysiriensis]GHC44487.1 hypothetical protein GCM10010308_74660 [Streptomyces vinaceusdrappus]
MNVQVPADPSGRLLWASPALPGAVHDVRAAREHDIVRKLTDAGITRWTDKGYRGAGGTVRVPLGPSGDTSRGQKDVNRSHAKKWVLVEQAAATLNAWRLLRNLRCSTSGVTSLVRSVVTVHLASTDGKGSMTTF